jgi:hypothetical protein
MSTLTLIKALIWHLHTANVLLSVVYLQLILEARDLMHPQTDTSRAQRQFRQKIYDNARCTRRIQLLSLKRKYGIGNGFRVVSW